MHISEMKLYDYLEQCLVNPTNIKLKLYILHKSCMEHMHFPKRQSDLGNILNKDLFKSIIHRQPFLTMVLSLTNLH